MNRHLNRGISRAPHYNGSLRCLRLACSTQLRHPPPAAVADLEVFGYHLSSLVISNVRSVKEDFSLRRLADSTPISSQAVVLASCHVFRKGSRFEGEARLAGLRHRGGALRIACEVYGGAVGEVHPREGCLHCCHIRWITHQIPQV